MQNFKRLARIGFYVTLIGVIGHEAILVLRMPYIMYQVFDWNLTGLLIVAFVVSIFALLAGRAADVSFKEGRIYYLLVGISMFISGCELANIGYVILRRFLWRFNINV